MLETSDTEIENCKSVRTEMCFAINSLLKVLLLAKFCIHCFFMYKNDRFIILFLLLVLNRSCFLYLPNISGIDWLYTLENCLLLSSCSICKYNYKKITGL